MLYLYEKAVNYKDICAVFTTNSVHLFKQSNKKCWKTVLFRCLDLIYLHHKFINI